MGIDRKKQGFSLLELLIAVAAGGILVAIVCHGFIHQRRMRADEEQKVTMQQSGRAITSIIANGLRMAGYSPGNAKDAGLREATLKRLTYAFDKDEDGVIESSKGEVVTIYHQNGTLWREQATVKAPLSEDVEAFAVLYAWDDESRGAKGYGDLEPPGRAISWGTSTKNDGWLDAVFFESPSGMVDFSGAPNTSAKISVKNIRAAQIWVLMKSHQRKKLESKEAYAALQMPFLDSDGKLRGLDGENDLDHEFSYRLFSKTVKLRNMNY